MLVIIYHVFFSVLAVANYASPFGAHASPQVRGSLQNVCLASELRLTHESCVNYPKRHGSSS